MCLLLVSVCLGCGLVDVVVIVGVGCELFAFMC